jgi:hypothetical protein
MNQDKNISSPEPPDDAFTIRCPRLGHQINYPYCREENNGLPCFKTLDCWYTYFDVQTHLRARLTENEFKRAFQNKTAPKILSLLDLINQAKQHKEEAD